LELLVLLVLNHHLHSIYLSLARGFRKIREFKGFGAKIGSLLIRVYTNLGIIELPKIDKLYPPVDIHDVKIAFYTCGRLKKFTYSHRYVKCVQKLSLFVANRLNIKWTVLDCALWLVGVKCCNKNLCSVCPIKIYCNKKAFLEEGTIV
jgi:hypothetical protein